MDTTGQGKSSDLQGRMNYTDYKTTFFEGLDWTKPIRDLMVETGASYMTLLKWRKRLGKEKVTKHSSIPWESLDWSKNDQELSFELGINPGTVRQRRIRLLKPVATHHNWHKNGEPLLIGEEQKATADWEWFTDVELGRRWGCSREYVRQKRQAGRFPECKLKHFHGASADALRWIEDHKAELEGKTIKEACRIIPSELSMESKRRWLARAGVRLSNKRERTTNKWMEFVNWELPNLVLALVWGTQRYIFAVTRYSNLKAKPKWATGYFGRCFEKPEFHEAVQAEFVKAREHGRSPDEEGFARWVEYRKGLLITTSPPAQETELRKGQILPSPIADTPCVHTDP